MSYPLRVATSGVERVAQPPLWANGEWRMCDRGLNNTIRKCADPDIIPAALIQNQPSPLRRDLRKHAGWGEAEVQAALHPRRLCVVCWSRLDSDAHKLAQSLSVRNC
jgi:hypothetical protein